MTGTEQDDYQRILEIIHDQMALEDHQRREQQGYGAIEFSRADAYRNIVKTLIGVDIVARTASAQVDRR